MPDETYKMRMSLNVLKHLGIGLYSNMPTVLSEAVANAWDADAENVDIAIDYDKRTITIQDDGHGMNVKDANDKYLRVGYERRKDGGESIKKKRIVMGRKGIGKLSLFSIAHTVEVRSVKDGEAHGFSMNVKDIKIAIKEDRGDYHPRRLPTPDLKRGTRITLSDLQLQLRKTDALKRKLARRFTIIDDDFNMTINGEKILPEDRGYQDKLQYVCVLGERGKKIMSGAENLRQMEIDPKIISSHNGFEIDGWIGTALKSSQLVEDTHSINRIAIIVRGKMAQEDVLEELGEGGIYSKYVVGEIHADFLDQNGKEDIATSSRQKFKEDDPRYEGVREKIREILKTIESQWTKLRNQEGKKVALMIPAIKEWYSDLPKDRRLMAEDLFGKINRLPVDDDPARRHLFVNGILAFESLRLKDMLDQLDKLDAHDLEKLGDIFLQMDDLEAIMFYQTTKTRLKVINTLKQMVDANSLEKAIQQHVFDHLWLIDPSWEKITGSGHMERTVATEFKEHAKLLTDEERRGRIDIRYKSVGNKHIIVEMKRPGMALDSTDITKQAKKYRSAMKNILKATGRENEPVEVVCIVGDRLKDWTDADERKRSEDSLKPYSIRIVFYNQIIETAKKAYSEYLTDEDTVSRVYKLIKRIEQHAQ